MQIGLAGLGKTDKSMLQGLKSLDERDSCERLLAVPRNRFGGHTIEQIDPRNE